MINSAVERTSTTSLPPSTLTPSRKDEYWKIVEECLTKFLNMDLSEACRETHDLRTRLGKDAEELIYHDEPFYVASDIAKLHEIPDQEALLDIHRDGYELILIAHNW